MGFLKYALLAAKIVQDNYFSQPRVKGFIGEKEVRIHLRYEPFLLYDFNIPGAKHTQIDHILINIKGIIVIETKNYGGVIKGSEKSEIWIQFLNKKKSKFYSPIKQNEYHIKRLKETFAINDVPIYSIICFPSKSILSVTAETKVIYIKNLNETINQLPNWNCQDYEVKKVYEILKDYKDKQNMKS